MTRGLAKRRDAMLKIREQKVETLYKEKAIRILREAEDYFVNHPSSEDCVIFLNVRTKNAKAFFHYLRKLAMDDRWGFWVARLLRYGIFSKKYCVFIWNDLTKIDSREVQDAELEYKKSLSDMVN